jgi:hypothetical protein
MSTSVVSYMLLEVFLFNVAGSHDEVIRKVETLLDTFLTPYGSVEVECIEHAGQDVASE